MTHYVLRTDSLSQPYYFTGICEGVMQYQIAISTSIFEASSFDTMDDAQECIKDLSLDEDFTISECGDFEFSGFDDETD